MKRINVYAKIILIMLFLVNFNVFSQIKIISESTNKNQIKIIFNSNLNYKIYSNNEREKFFKIPDFDDISKPGTFKLPSNQIIISLPIYEKPKISFKILKQKFINAIPEINDSVIIIKDEIKYVKSANVHFEQRKRFSIKGYLWIENSFCVVVEFNPALFDFTRRQVSLVEEFEIALAFSKNLNLVSKKIKKNKNKIISNSQYAITGVKNKYVVKDSDDWIDYSKKYVKIGTALDGVYRIYRDDLLQFGVPVDEINPQTLKLLLRGEEIPIFVKGENDGNFDDGDFIEFVGLRNMGGHHRELSETTYNEYLGRYTDTTVYWLTWGDENGIRVEVSDGSGEISDTIKYYSQIDHYEINKWFDFSCREQVRREMPYWCSNKTWHEGNIEVGTRNRNFACSDVYPNQTAKAFIKLQDFASNVYEDAHSITFGINSGNWSDTVTFNKYQKVVIENDFNSNLLSEGTNKLNIKSLPTNATLNKCIFDWYEVEYPRYLKTIGDSLIFQFPFITQEVEKTIDLQDATADNFVLWRYGDKYKKFNVNKIDSNIYFNDTLNNQCKYVYLDSNKILKPKIYYLKQFKNLRSSENNAEYLAITHKKFINQVNQYAEFIADNYNLSTKVIDIDDIYDEYSYGFFNPEAIRDFLMSTHNYWQEPYPDYVALIGAATYDYFGFKHQYFDDVERKINYVPSYGAPVSDSWFVIWDSTGANVLQMNIGRLPVESNEQLQWYFSKLQDYVNQDYDDWNKRYLFFSGGNEDEPSELDQMREANQYIIDNYVKPAPIGGNYAHFYKTLSPPSNFGPYSTEFIDEAISNGSVFISYIGHSGTQTWDNSIIDPAQLHNDKGRYPLVTDFGCSTGRFAEPDVKAFGEMFTMDASGEAIGYTGNASLGFKTTSLLAPKIFYKNLLIDSVYTISEAHRLAKLELIENYGSSDVNILFTLTNTFFGDPIVSLPIPKKPNFHIEKSYIKLLSENLTDLSDSAYLNIAFYNWGKVIDDSLKILIIHQIETFSDTLIQNLPIPHFNDSLNVAFPINSHAGNHSLRIILDPENIISEINEDDNQIEYSYYVASASIRPMLNYQLLNGVKDSLYFINPTEKTNTSDFLIELADNSSFNSSITRNVLLTKVFSSYSVDNIPYQGRVWGRVKLTEASNFSNVFSFYKNNFKYLINDSLSFSKITTENIFIKNNNLVIDTTKIKFRILSAGFTDGNTVLIMKNSTNYVYDATLRGHYVTLFMDSTYDFVSSHVFDLLGGGNEVAQQYYNFLDTLSSKYLVCFAIKDEGAIHLTNNLRNKIKEFGSVLIDSVDFRASWAFMGKRGAQPGSMPEAFSHEGDGYVEIDTTIAFLSDFGSLATTQIGPATNWKEIGVSDSIPDGGSISYRILGERAENDYDTLGYLSLNNGVADLSFLNDSGYAYIKVQADFVASPEKISPVLKSIGVNYDSYAELGTNYQVVALDRDTLDQGETLNLNFSVYNVGEVRADSFKVRVDLVEPDNSTQKLFEEIVDTLSPKNKRDFTVSYNTSNYKGEGEFKISIDTENKVPEFFEDNNYYLTSFYVVADTSTPALDVTIDGKDILDWEYISNKPTIKIELSDDFPLAITDTSSVVIKLNGEQIYYNNPDREDAISDENPKYVVTYTPDLQTGEYTLYVNGYDANGNPAYKNGIEKHFKVSTSAQLLEVYNYPNPFENDTYFTFKLTQIPDELKIRIFTVAGRLIREIELSPSDLTYDFNRIYWDGRDQDGDRIANGVYFYKIILKKGDETVTKIQKLAVMR